MAGIFRPSWGYYDQREPGPAVFDQPAAPVIIDPTTGQLLITGDIPALVGGTVVAPSAGAISIFCPQLREIVFELQ